MGIGPGPRAKTGHVFANTEIYLPQFSHCGIEVWALSHAWRIEQFLQFLGFATYKTQSIYYAFLNKNHSQSQIYSLDLFFLTATLWGAMITVLFC